MLGRPYIYKGQNNKLYAAGTTAQETRFQNYIDNAISTAHVDYNRYYAPTTFLTSEEKALYSYNNWSIVNSYERQFGYPGNGYRWVPRNSAYDTAWMVGYKVRYGYAAGIQTENNGTLTDNAENYYENNSSAHGVIKDRAQDQVVTRTTSYGYNAGYENITPQGAWANNGTYDVTRYTDYWGNTTTANVIRWNTDTKRIYDYGDKRTLSWVDGKQQIDDTSDNLTPTKATFEVRFQNQFDGTVGNDVNNNRAAHLTRISLKSTFDENITATEKKAFRLQNVYVPAYLVRNGENAKTDHVYCDDHANGTCISYQYTPFVKIGDEYIKYTGPRALDGDNKIVTKPGSVQTITGELKTEGDKVTDTRECSSVTDARQIYLTITGDVYTKDDNAYIEATACGGQENKDCSCVECDGGWFNATNFRFKYMDADGAEKEVNVTFDELKAAGRVSGPWKIDEGEAASGPSGTARIVYDENGNPTFDADGDYVIDFESFFRAYVASSADDESGEGADAASAGNAGGKNIISYSTYNGVSATNTIAGFSGDAKMDQTYAKALFTELEITFEAPNANRRFANTSLDAGQWLTRQSQYNVGTTQATSAQSNTMVNYAFKYDGIYVDRPVELFTSARAATNTLTHDNVLTGEGVDDAAKTNAGNFDYDSTPTFGKQASAYAGTDSRHKLTIDLKAKDPNTEGLAALVDDEAAYRVSHKLGTMDVSYVRGRKIDTAIGYGTNNGGTSSSGIHVDGSNGTLVSKNTVFAYDADDRSMTNIFSYKPTNTANDVPDGALYAGDYLEYTLYLGANLQSVLPLQHMDARFTVGRGQRIVGWEVVTDRIPTEGGLSADKVQLNTVGANDRIGVTGPHPADAPRVNTSEPPKTTDVRFYDADAKAARVTATLLGDPKTVTGEGGTVTTLDNVTMRMAPASTDLTKIAHDTAATVTAAEGAETALVDAAAGEYNASNRALVFSVGSQTQQALRGEGVYIRVITQMTDELEADAEAYNEKNNDAFTNDADRPSYSADQVQAVYTVTAAPRHGYSQYKVEQYSSTNGTLSDSNGDRVYKSMDDEALDTVDYSHPVKTIANLDNRLQYGGSIESKVRFYNHSDSGDARAPASTPW